MVRREIKDFLGSTTVQQMEKKILEMISKELKKGSLRGDVNNAIINIMKEFYQIMWTRKGFWENQLKNVK